MTIDISGSVWPGCSRYISTLWRGLKGPGSCGWPWGNILDILHYNWLEFRQFPDFWLSFDAWFLKPNTFWRRCEQTVAKSRSLTYHLYELETMAFIVLRQVWLSHCLRDTNACGNLKPERFATWVKDAKRISQKMLCWWTCSEGIHLSMWFLGLDRDDTEVPSGLCEVGFNMLQLISWTCSNYPVRIILIWLMVWNMNFMTFHILGMSSSQLTNSIIFQRGRAPPPTSHCEVAGAHCTWTLPLITRYLGAGPTQCPIESLWR
jgi:hypothetical protein